MTVFISYKIPLDGLFRKYVKWVELKPSPISAQIQVINSEDVFPKPTRLHFLMQIVNKPTSLVLKSYIHQQIVPITNNDKFDCPFPPSLHLLTVIDDINRSILPTYQAVRIYNLHISLLTSPGVMTGPCKKSLVMFSKISNHGFLEVPLHFIHKDSWGPGTWQASVLLWVEKWAGEHQVSRLLTTSNSQVTENDHHKHFITSVYCHTLIYQHVLNAIPVRRKLRMQLNFPPALQFIPRYQRCCLLDTWTFADISCWGANRETPIWASIHHEWLQQLLQA